MAKKTHIKKLKQQKFIFITGGVVSSVGKGLTAASVGALLEARGVRIAIMKFDPYINVDPGTMSPFQHGEVYVTDDGAETELDLGQYERFTSVRLSRSNSVSTGQIYESVINKERKGDYLGGTVQVIPHVTDEIKSRIFEVAQDAEVTLVEIGGTVGDIEGLPFLEAIRQLRVDLGSENSSLIHVTYVPFIAAAGELKSKPSQHSVKELRSLGLQPDFLVCRAERPLDKSIRAKLGLFCNLKADHVIAALDLPTIYEAPLALHQEGLDELIVQSMKIKCSKPAIGGWKRIIESVKEPQTQIRIGLVGKYVDLKESYKSLHEAIVHGGIAHHAKVEIEYIDSEELNSKNVNSVLNRVHAVLVPGGFGHRGVEGKIAAIKYAREKSKPFLGICFGMQLAAVEFARNVCGLKHATSREFSDGKSKDGDFVIDIMSEQRALQKKGGTMRLGAFQCHLQRDSLASRIYKKEIISERHRHRFEFNNTYLEVIQSMGLRASGINKQRNLVEILELQGHPWFVGVQFHPEFQSKPLTPHPLFSAFVKAAIANRKS